MTEEKIVFNVAEQDGKFAAFRPRISTVSMAPDAADAPGAGITRIAYPDHETAGWGWAPWGDDNLLPTHIRQKLEKAGMPMQALYKLAALMYGNGLAYHRRSDLAGEDATIRRAWVPEVEAFLQASRIRTKWLPAQFMDYRMHINTFSEVILSQDRSLVTNLFHKDAEFTRLSEQHPRSFRTEYLLYSPRFVSDITPQEVHIKKIPLYQWDDEEYFLSRLRGFKFAWHSYFPMPGTVYYAKAPWQGLFRKDGWLDVAISVPEIVSAMMRNQIRIKYQIVVHVKYFQLRFPDWDKYTQAQKEAEFTRFETKINSSLIGTKNAYNSILNVVGSDNMNGEIGRIEIIAIDDKTKQNDWVPSSYAANAEIIQAMGYSPSMMEIAPDTSKLGGGSGSDKREIYNFLLSTNTIEQDIILEPLNWLAEYNARTNPAWDVVFFIDHTFHTTSNLKEDGMAPSPTTLTQE